jgi:hypothetical protein
VTAAARARLRSRALAGVALLAAAPLGVVAATPARSWLFAGAGVLAVAAATVRGFRRDPVMTLLALWAFQVVRTPLAAATSSLPAAGPLIDQLTDVCVLVILATLAWEQAGRDAPRRDLRYFWPAIGLACCGLAGSVLQGGALHPTLAGLWLGTKLWLLVGVTATVAWRPADLERVLRVLVGLGGVAAALGILDAVTGGGVANMLHSNLHVTVYAHSYRAGAAQSVYAHPNEYSLAMSLLVAVCLARIATKGRVRPQDVAVLCLFIAAAVVSLRVKAVLSVAAVFAVVAAAQLLRRKRHALTVLGAGAICGVLIATFMGNVVERQLTSYFGSTTTARAELYRGAARIVDDHLPFGVGFGRFGSAPSRDMYSTVYDDYGLSDVWGLSRAFPNFITDTSWPAVAGETGLAGLLVFVAGLLALMSTGVATLRAARGPDAFAPLALIAVLVVVMVDSTGNSTLFTWNTSTMLALVAGPALAQRRAWAAARVVAPAGRETVAAPRSLAAVGRTSA